MIGFISIGLFVLIVGLLYFMGGSLLNLIEDIAKH